MKLISQKQDKIMADLLDSDRYMIENRFVNLIRNLKDQLFEL